jgi:hypothetical protein
MEKGSVKLTVGDGQCTATFDGTNGQRFGGILRGLDFARTREGVYERGGVDRLVWYTILKTLRERSIPFTVDGNPPGSEPAAPEKRNAREEEERGRHIGSTVNAAAAFLSDLVAAGLVVDVEAFCLAKGLDSAQVDRVKVLMASRK